MWKLINGQMVWVAEAPDEPPTGGDNPPADDDPPEDAPPPAPDDESELLKNIKGNPVRTEKEIRDLRQENADFRKRLSDIEGEQEAARKQDLADKQEYKTLYEEADTKLQAAQTRVTELEAELEAYHQSDSERLETLSADLPDHLRELIGKMTPRDALVWIEAHEDDIRKPKAPGTDAGASGDKTDKKHEPAYYPKVRL